MEQKNDYNLHRIQSLVNNGEDLNNLDNYKGRGGVGDTPPGSITPRDRTPRGSGFPVNLPALEKHSTSPSTISSLFLEEITNKKKDFLTLNSTQHFIDMLTNTFDEKLNEQIKSFPNTVEKMFACLDINKLFDIENDPNFENFSKRLTIYNDTSTKIDESAKQYLIQAITQIKSDVDATIEEAKEANKSPSPILALEGGSNQIFNALLINNQINKTSNTVDPYNTRDIDPVENDTMQIHELLTETSTKGGIVNFVNKKTRRKKYKKPKKITRRRLNQK